ncbi:MAG: hypothetical protein CGW95_11780 [Phenylobacterium zucineum]|nr:MAG: hypothetical protein CGW95_11780 [Phenylobacterium zucineum]
MSYLTPEWPAPPGVRAASTLRGETGSLGPYRGLNLGAHVGDDPDHVRNNRDHLMREFRLSNPPAWLDQVHGTTCVKAHPGIQATADASFTDQNGIACIVMTADCLPVLFTTRDGQRVAAAHAGWKGLAGGVLEATLASLGTLDVLVWLGPAIGPTAFEVGPEVRDAFLHRHPDAGKAFSNPHKDRYHADLYGLARGLLTQAGVPAESIYGGGRCTYLEADAFFSYRRDRTTGRMASLIWRE